MEGTVLFSDIAGKVMRCSGRAWKPGNQYRRYSFAQRTIENSWYKGSGSGAAVPTFGATILSMRSESERWTGALLHGWVELLTLFGMLFFALVLIGWCWNRGLRPSDRPSIVPWPLLVTGYALALLLRHFNEGLWPPLIIATGVIVAGVIARVGSHRGLWIPVMLLAAFLGLGYNLSFALLSVVIMLVLLLSAGRDR